MDRYVAALLKPSGRLTRGAFLSLSVPLGLLITLVHLKLRGSAGGEVYGLGYGLFLALMWSQYCLMSRRLQDSDRPGLLIAPIYIVATAGSLISLDPLLVGQPDDAANGLGIAITLKSIGDVVLGLVYLVLLKLASSDGPNRFGAPFATEVKPMVEAGEPDWVANATRSLESVRNAATLTGDTVAVPATHPPRRAAVAVRQG